MAKRNQLTPLPFKELNVKIFINRLFLGYLWSACWFIIRNWQLSAGR